jgi:voltage-gated potassium channel
MNLKQRVHAILEGSASGTRAGRLFELWMLSLIGLNVLAPILETVEQVHRSAPDLFYAFEMFSVAVFTAEYILRLWSCTGNEKYDHPIYGRLRFAFTPLSRGPTRDPAVLSTWDRSVFALYENRPHVSRG